MASPRGHFDGNDFRAVLLNLLMVIVAAVVSWGMTEGIEFLHTQEWMPAALVPLIYAILNAVQRWIGDTRVDPGLAQRPPKGG